MKYDINGVFIKLAINKGIKDIKINPKRGVRNLVDLGYHFSSSKAGENFFKIVADVLKDESSMYYDIIKNLVDNVDNDILRKFSYNLGYNGIKKSINKIENRNFVKVLDIKNYDLLKEFKDTGIYSYIIHVDSTTKIDLLIKVLSENNDCAFLIILDENINIDLESISKNKNYIISLNYDKTGNYKELLEEIKNKKILYSVHYRIYDNEYILSDEFIKDVEKEDINIAFLINDSKDINITKYVVNSRWHQEYKVFLIDLYEDIDFINALINN